MDPLQFGVNGDVVAEVLGLVVVLSLFLERALALLFEWRVFIDRRGSQGLKEPIAFAAAALVVIFYQFDALAVVFSNEQPSYVGYVITAGIVAGGSKGSVKLFRDLLGWKSEAQKTYEDTNAIRRSLKSGPTATT
jgi:hypothetical protein